MTIEDTDFFALYEDQMRHAGFTPKPPGAWDERSAGYGRRGATSHYGDDFIGRLDLSGARTLLDVGCGPGTLALPLAARLQRVIAVDHSPGMLAALRERATTQGITNVDTLLRSWGDDWSDVPVCDIAIASRSLTVTDLRDALGKLISRARLRVCVTYLDGGSFVDPEILELAGVPGRRIPDHAIVVGALRQMGFQPQVGYIDTPARFAGSADFAEFAQRLRWHTGPLDDAALGRLRRWYDADPVRARAGGRPVRWAFISWECSTPDADGRGAARQPEPSPGSSHARGA